MSAPQIEMPPGCGNSPKNKFLAELCIAVFNLAKLPIDIPIDDNVTFVRLDGEIVSGFSAFMQDITSSSPPSKISLIDVATHGRAGFIDGVASFGENDEYFAIKVRFKSAAAKLVTHIQFYRGVGEPK